MDIERQIIRNDGFGVPCVMLKPAYSSGAAVIVHGYGGCKEELLGLAWRVAESGITTCTIDLRGHGEHPLPMDGGISKDVEAAIIYCRQFGKIIAIGHSLGGRLVLLSSADFVIAISPALDQTFSEQTQKIVEDMRGYRVNKTTPSINFEILHQLPTWRPGDGKPGLILVGTRDVPEIKRACQDLKLQGVPVMEIGEALHNDIFLLEKTFCEVTRQMKIWL